MFPDGGRQLKRVAGILGVLMLMAPPILAAGVHRGGVAACITCHVMHEESGATVTDGLLRGDSASDVCLNCHALAFGAVLGLDPMAPPPERGAGNFAFLWEDNINDGPEGILNPLSGDAAGHNLVAPGHGLASDGSSLRSPGGDYPSADLGCTSCHDPHGNGNYRFLRGPAQSPRGQVFLFPAFSAESPNLDGAPENRSNHVAYRQGVSRWCANCHGNYLRDHDGSRGFQHPVDETLEYGMIQQYNRYNGTADPWGGVAATAYLPEVPFEDPAADVSSMAGPGPSSRVMCLTCHRAHATSAPHSGRWDFNVMSLGEDGVASGSYPLPNPYGDPGQERLCRKCHSGLMNGD